MMVSFHYGKYRVNGTINDQNLVEFTGTWIANPIYGDMPYEMRYTQYRELQRRHVSRLNPCPSG